MSEKHALSAFLGLLDAGATRKTGIYVGACGQNGGSQIIADRTTYDGNSHEVIDCPLHSDLKAIVAG